MIEYHTKRIGNMTYIVSLKQSETAKKTLDEKIRELVIKEVWRRALRTATIQ